MKKYLFFLALIIPALAFAHVIDDSQNPRFLYVLSAHSGSFDGETLTLTGVPSVVYFSDRPYRIAGHMLLEEFVEMWGEGADNFAADPPNATLSILGEDGNTDIIVELTNTLLIENGVTFEIQVLEGSVPESFGLSSLFIDEPWYKEHNL